MRKLLLAPFLLASLFSFGGELKANPDSRYELPDPRNINNDPLGNQLSSNVWYLIMNNFVISRDEWSSSPKWTKDPRPLPAFKFIPTSSSKLNCNNMGRQLSSWLGALDLEGDDIKNFKYRTYYKCIKTSNSSNANTYLFINSQPMVELDDGDKSMDSRDISVPNPLGILYFSDFSKCNMAKIKLDSWFLNIKNKMLSDPRSYRFYKVDTKCLNK